MAVAEVPGRKPATVRNWLMLAAARPAKAVQNWSSMRSGTASEAFPNTPMPRNILRNASSIGRWMKEKPSAVETPGNASATLPVVHVTPGSHAALSSGSDPGVGESMCDTNQRLVLGGPTDRSPVRDGHVRGEKSLRPTKI